MAVIESIHPIWAGVGVFSVNTVVHADLNNLHPNEPQCPSSIFLTNLVYPPLECPDIYQKVVIQGKTYGRFCG